MEQLTYGTILCGYCVNINIEETFYDKTFHPTQRTYLHEGHDTQLQATRTCIDRSIT